MTPYSIVLFVHLVGALGLFIGFGIEWTATAFSRRSTNSEQIRLWLQLLKVVPPVSGAGLLLLLLSGGYLAKLIGVMKQGWILATLLAIAVVILIGVILNGPRMRIIRRSLPTTNEPLSAAFRARLQDPLLAMSIRTRTSLALGIVFLMATKQPFSISLIVLACAAVFGFVISVPAFLRKPEPAAAA